MYIGILCEGEASRAQCAIGRIRTISHLTLFPVNVAVSTTCRYKHIGGRISSRHHADLLFDRWSSTGHPASPLHPVRCIVVALPFLSAESPCFRDGTRRVPTTMKRPALRNGRAIVVHTLPSRRSIFRSERQSVCGRDTVILLHVKHLFSARVLVHFHPCARFGRSANKSQIVFLHSDTMVGRRAQSFGLAGSPRSTPTCSASNAASP